MLHVKAKAAPGKPGVLTLVLPVTLAAAATTAAAAASLATHGLSQSSLAGLLALFAAATLIEAVPLPIGGIPIGKTSLASVFVVGTAVLYGWAAVTVMSVLMQLTVEAGRRRPLVRVAYNGSVYAFAAAAAGAAAAGVEASALDHVLAEVASAAAAFYTVDLVLVTLIVARTTHEPFRSLLERTLASTVLPLTIMASLSVILVILWEESPFLAAALFGPLIGFDLYQRAQLRTLEAMEAALTDPVTGIGNRRRFEERLGEEVPPPDPSTPVSIALLDVDGLQRINDRYGRPTGDRALAAVGARLAASGEAFRLGDDEFALLLPGRAADEARLLVELVLVDLALGAGLDEPIRVSGGLAAYPRDEETPSGLVARADEALYRSKREAPGTVQARSSAGLSLHGLPLVTESPADRVTRLEVAASLARAVDSRDPRGRRHSESVGRLAARVAARLGLDEEQCELLGLAGRLHDLGKVAIPEEILEKPGPLDPDERRVVERHPVLGSNMLLSLGLRALAPWVLHHHERWDGQGYPDGLSGEAIPLPARILFAADAFDAMTSEWVYRRPLSREQAIAKLERCAGTQFDEAVVAALVAELREAAGKPT